MAVLQVFQAKLLWSMDVSGSGQATFSDLCSAKDLALYATKTIAQAIGRATASLVVLERHFWLNSMEIKDAYKAAPLKGRSQYMGKEQCGKGNYWHPQPGLPCMTPQRELTDLPARVLFLRPRPLDIPTPLSGLLSLTGVESCNEEPPFCDVLPVLSFIQELMDNRVHPFQAQSLRGGASL